ncbi:MAG TPA: sensor histidine kinase [Trebonia sp.]|nr:sensor histidine kinase [Trebonia sp.]
MAPAAGRAADPGKEASARRPPARFPSRGARIAATFLTGIWLAYLIPALAALLTRPYSPADRWGGLAIVVSFAAIYLLAVPNWPLAPWYALPALALLALLAVAACLLLGGNEVAGLWIFVSSASGLLVPGRRRAAAAVLGCTACYMAFALAGHSGQTQFFINLLPTVFVGLAMIGMRRQFQLTAELARAREEVVKLAANEERLRLARDMHDLTGQSLSTITLKSELAARLLGRLPAGPDLDRVRDEIEQVAAVSRQTLRDIREAVSGYRRPTLAVEIITARAALASADITARDDADLTLLSGTFDPDAEAALAWCLREAVTNVVRHSGARNCAISLAHRPGGMSLTVRDDGRGHAPSREGPPAAATAARAAHSRASVAAGTGLHGMAERLTAVGGSLQLRPDARPGFCLVATVPAVLAPLATPDAVTRKAPRTPAEEGLNGYSPPPGP